MGKREPEPAPPLDEWGRTPAQNARRRLALWITIGLSAAWWVASVALVIAAGELGPAVPWILTSGPFVVAATVVAIRTPEHPLAPWLAAVAVLYPASELALVPLAAALADPEHGAAAAAVWHAVGHELSLAQAVALAWIVGSFPRGETDRKSQRRTLRSLWALLVVPIVILLACPVVPVASWLAANPVANPFVGPWPVVDESVATALSEYGGVVPIVTAAIVLVDRYRSATRDQRRPMRWLLVPIALLPFVAIVAVLVALTTGADTLWMGWAASIALSGGFAVGFVLGILQPSGFSPDRAIRRTVTYGLLWVAITAVFIAIGAVVGTAAGTLLPLGWAAAITMLAAVAFQPARRGLEGLADRWIFGARPDPSRLVVALGESLADTEDLDAILPRITATLENGMGLSWVRIRLSGVAEEEPMARTDAAEAVTADTSVALTVPITVDGETVGVIECGPKRAGELRPDEIAIIETFARQAGIAVRNVALTDELAANAALLAASRARLVRAQELERRRIERNIHDGVQQDLTALIGVAGHARQSQDPTVIVDALGLMQEGLERVLADVRALAQGIHPSVLTDRGLLAAVEALAARHPIPVEVRADRRLRDRRLPEELEGAAYFTVAEALANSLKHAAAAHIDVGLELRPRSLRVTTRDDGVGISSAAANGTRYGETIGDRSTGTGLSNLAERVAAVGGTLDVFSSRGEGTTVAATFALAGEAS